MLRPYKFNHAAHRCNQLYVIRQQELQEGQCKQCCLIHPPFM